MIQYDTDKESNRMVRRGLMVELDFWEKCKEKANITPISAIIRKLLEQWLKGKIILDE